MEEEQNWDVEQHKMEHECDEHWELRRSFLLEHRDKFPEDELVCLAQVFTNIEFLGCRYPEETMQLVAELSQDVASEYRERQKNKLKRTFVKASDAAGAKAKGLNSGNRVGPRTDSKRTVQDQAVNKKMKFIQAKSQRNQFISNNNGPYGSIVLFERPNDNPINVIVCATNVSGGNLEWKFEPCAAGSKCVVLIDSKKLAEAQGSGQKSAKKEAAAAGVEQLRKHYYSIRVKKAFDGGTQTVINSQSLSDTVPANNPLDDDNIGRKLMKLMGWGGGGLGKSQQGIEEPVTVKQQVSREGLGLKDGDKFPKGLLKKKCQDMLREWMSSDMKTDLVFSSEFTNEERALMHQVAHQMGVKSHSHGPKDCRTLVVSRKYDPFELVAELKAIGGTTNKYQLIDPTG